MFVERRDTYCIFLNTIDNVSALSCSVYYVFDDEVS